MHVRKVGNNLAIVLPESLVSAFQLKEGDEVEIEIRPSTSKMGQPADAKTREAALERLRELSRCLPSGYRFDREEANAR